MTDVDIPELARKVSITHIGLQPENIIWSSVNTKQISGIMKNVIISTLIGLLTVILFVPAVYLGFIGGYDTLLNVMLSSDFMQNQTDTTRGIITELVPVVYIVLIKETMTIVCKRESSPKHSNSVVRNNPLTLTRRSLLH
jgi:hypothetical protein